MTTQDPRRRNNRPRDRRVIALSPEAKMALDLARDMLRESPAWIGIASQSTTIEWLVEFWLSQGEALMTRFVPKTGRVGGKRRVLVAPLDNPNHLTPADVERVMDRARRADDPKWNKWREARQAWIDKRRASGRERRLHQRCADLRKLNRALLGELVVRRRAAAEASKAVLDNPEAVE